VRRRFGARLVASVSVGWHETIEFKGGNFEREVILWGVRWYVDYPIGYSQLEEMMQERGVEVDHSTLNRWVLKYVPLLDKQFRACKRLVGSSWRMDETYVRVKGAWKYLIPGCRQGWRHCGFPSGRQTRSPCRFAASAQSNQA
jgi:transposase-like protein